MAGDERVTEFPTLTRSGDGTSYAIHAPRMASTSRYQVGEPIGRGGMGEVLAAQDLLIGREVAIKRMRNDDTSDAALTRFMREACVQGRLEHPAIVPVHELAVDSNGIPYFVMKKLSGTTLARIIAYPDPVRFSRQRLLRAFVEVCLAVEFAHTRGFLHRDLKPGNIVLGEFGDVYLIDWGVAKVVGAADAPAAASGEPEPGATAAGFAVGTPGYMAPEQARAEPDLDARCDVYALGCVLFEILTGERLHDADENGLRGTFEGTDARPSRRSGETIPPELDEICVAATQLRREDRPQSARDLAERVERFLDGDRDVELRKKLAYEQLELALAAFAREDPRVAMRHAGRALALDPTCGPAAELVGRLMLEPPKQAPPEVAQSVARDERESFRRFARIAMYAHVGYVIALALFGVHGYTSRFYPVAFALLIALNVVVLAVYAFSPARVSPIFGLVATAALIAVISRIFAPFLVGPALATVSACSFMLGALRPTWRNGLLAIAVCTGAVFVPYFAEQLGYLSSTFVMDDNTLTVWAPGLVRSNVPSLAFVIFGLLVVSAAVMIAAGVRRANERMRERMHVQSWLLQQLVPVAADQRVVAMR